MFLLIYVLDSVSFVMFVSLSLYSLIPDLWWIKLFIVLRWRLKGREYLRQQQSATAQQMLATSMAAILLKRRFHASPRRMADWCSQSVAPQEGSFRDEVLLLRNSLCTTTRLLLLLLLLMPQLLQYATECMIHAHHFYWTKQKVNKINWQQSAMSNKHN